MVVHDPHLGPVQRHSDGAGFPTLPADVGRRNPGKLGQTIALVYLAAERPLEVTRDLERDGSASDVRDPDRGKFSDPASRLAQRDAHRRHTQQNRRARVGHPAKRGLSFEALDDGDGAPAERGATSPVD